MEDKIKMSDVLTTVKNIWLNDNEDLLDTKLAFYVEHNRYGAHTFSIGSSELMLQHRCEIEIQIDKLNYITSIKYCDRNIEKIITKEDKDTLEDFLCDLYTEKPKVILDSKQVDLYF